MAGSVNKAILVGNLAKDPEGRGGQDGAKIVNLTLATSESWKDRASGETKERTEWHRVVIFNDRLGELVERYAKKGDKLYVEGQLQTRKWTDKEGQERYSTEIVVGRFNGSITFLSERSGGGSGGGGDRRAPSNGGTKPQGAARKPDPGPRDLDEIPF